jgi:hypothetical protein
MRNRALTLVAEVAIVSKVAEYFESRGWKVSGLTGWN